MLTDNGKVFTGRFGPGTGEVLFDRVCRENGIKHRLTRPRSPTTTGKVERWHKTLRREFLTGKVFDSIENAQAELDVWVEHYNHRRPHQSIGMVPPIRRFELARNNPPAPSVEPVVDPAGAMSPAARRKVTAGGKVSFASVLYHVGVAHSGATVDIVCDAGLVHIHHHGVLLRTHVRRHDPAKQQASIDRAETGARRKRASEPERSTASAVSVTRKVDSSGNVCFAGANYRVGNSFKRRQVQVAVVGGHVEIAIGEQLIRKHPIKHDRTREHGALANPGGRPRRVNAA